MEVNSIYEGDNLEIMSKFPDKSVDLMYADPPFYTNKRFEIIWKDGAEKRAFEDRWAGGIEHYTAWMEPRLRECHRLLKNTGSFYLHCDYHASAHLRILLDKIFGESNFRNEIIWKRKTGRGETQHKSKQFGVCTDYILFYSKSKDSKFNSQFKPVSEADDEYKEYVKKFYTHIDKEGRKFQIDNLASPSPRPNLTYEYKGYKPPAYGWAIEKEKMEQWDKEGRLWFPANKKGRIRRKRFLDELKGQPIQNLWDDIQPISSQSNERLGYPTQKPVALLERMIVTSSDKGDLVLDPFCGCGTTIVAAQKLGRKWIGIDVSPTACKLMQKRLRKEFSVSVHIIRGEVDLNYVKKLAPFEFQNWVITDKFLGKVSERKVGDMGIDGFTPQVLGGYPIQVKQSPDVGRNVVDNFETAMRRIGKKKGYIVAFSFGKGAIEEVARIKNAGELDIILRTVQELLDGRVD
ncbi:MAG: Type III restriction-modification system methylation subunit [Candidatus Fermentimicrarchaeum limneticum]|uniref:Type II methyltransferase n=1 Tax=Fermentimicrarchaeum limneticum TaxID=2795018 RepID=A0A7D5XPR5_FERL1|nr:MAG: Type III restriction-modification system methylation subunit [Candidatus Fermentimicrarchaeum limneticum]